MKRALCAGILTLTIALMTLVGCGGGGTPVPPVSKLIDLDKLVMNGQIITQVQALMTPALQGTVTLYQAQTIELTGKGNWTVISKEGGFKAGETGPFQALWFQPEKTSSKSYGVFFKENVVIGKAWFDSRNAAIIEALLQGKSFIK